MIDLIQNKRKELQDLCLQYDIEYMYVFGSASSGDFDENSDIDILISFKAIPFEKYTDNYFDLHQKLENLFLRKVDLVTERSMTNPFFIESVEKTKKLLYAA